MAILNSQCWTGSRDFPIPPEVFASTVALPAPVMHGFMVHFPERGVGGEEVTRGNGGRRLGRALLLVWNGD